MFLTSKMIGYQLKLISNYYERLLSLFPTQFTGKLPVTANTVKKPKAAIVHKKGSNSESEMVNAMYLASFDVKDTNIFQMNN